MTLFETFIRKRSQISNVKNESDFDFSMSTQRWVPNNSYIHSMYIKAAKSFFNVPREKLSPRQTISRILKDFAAKVYTTCFLNSPPSK
jgi:hypothetical protein